MFRTLSSTADPIDCSEPKDKDVTLSPDNSKSSDSSNKEDPDAVERASSQDSRDEIEQNEKASSRPSSGLKRTTSNAPSKASTGVRSTKSNALSKVASRMTTHSITDPGPPPDGGFRAWTQVAAGWLAILTTWGWINCFGVFQTYYTLNLDASPSAISWIGTVQNFLSFFIGAFSGRLLDAGYFLPTVLTGVTLQLLGIFMQSLCTKYWQLLLTQGILTGVGGGIFFTPCMGLLATWWSKRRALAMGIASTGNSAGGLVYPVIVRQLLPKIGFAWTVRTLGFVNLALLSVVIALMKPRLPPRKSGAIIDFAAFKEAPFALYTLALFFQVWCIYFTLYYVTSFGVEAIGLSLHDSTVLLIIINGIGVPARVVPGWIADKFGQLNTMLPVSYCVFIVAWTWVAVHDTVGIYLFACFYGVLAAAFQCLLPPTVASLTDDLSMIGTRLGMVFSCMGFAGLTGPPIGGAIQGAQGGSYIGAQCWSATSSFLCAVLVTAARVARAKGKLKVKV